MSTAFASAKAAQAKKAAGRDVDTSGMTEKEKEMEKLKQELSIDAHKILPDVLAEKYSSSLTQGLTSSQAKKNLEKYGENKLTPPPEDPEWLKFLHTQTGFFSLLLWAGGILCFISYSLRDERENLYLGIVLCFVVLATGIFEYFQERKSSDLMNSFKSLLPPKVNVVRDGKPAIVDSALLTPGDIVNIKAGDKIPADLRVVTCSADCKVDQASLTGEPDALKRRPAKTHDNPLETENLMFFGTLCPSGKATAMVVGVGDDTVMGRISRLATATDNVETPISKEIKHFVLIVSSVAIFLGVSFFTIGMVKDFVGTGTVNATTQLVFMIGIIVANVPEGLLATVTVCLTLTAKSMYKKNVLVKNLESVETLGSTTCICSDKTGTLTQNTMTVTNLALDGRIYEYKYANQEGKNIYPVVDLNTEDGDYTGTIVKVNDSIEGSVGEITGTSYDIEFDNAELGTERGWITQGMFVENGNTNPETWMEDTPDKKYAAGDKVTVRISSDTMNRMVRVCACCNNTVFVGDSQIVRARDAYTKGERLAIMRQCEVEGDEWPEGQTIPFRWVRENPQGSSNPFSYLTDQWKTAGDATESAMVRWVQDKPLFEDKSYEAVGAKKPKLPAERVKTSRSKEVIAYENSLPGVAKYREAYPICSVTENVSTENPKGTTRRWAIPFNSKNKFQVSVHKQNNDENSPALLLMKGGSDVVMRRCSHVMHNGQRVKFNDDLRQRYNDLNLALAKMGRRVLAAAELELGNDMPATWGGFNTETSVCNFPLGNSDDFVAARAAEMRKNNDEAKANGMEPPIAEADIKAFETNSSRGLTFIGLCALIDPHRPAVPGAVKKCHTAGIKVVMVTGDHPATAQAIAKEVNIIWEKQAATAADREEINLKKYGVKRLEDGDKRWSDTSVREAEDPFFAPAIVVAGHEFSADTPKATWDSIMSHSQIVFARTSPTQKLIIVEQFQKRGEVVAVTGDGVNDAPALKKADIGVAMGIMGTEVSKEAADMILLDDNFASIVRGVEEGRLIFDNLKKSIAYTLSSNIPEISPFLSFITVGIPLPLSTVLILCIDLGTDMVPAISMAWEHAEADIMRRAPRDQKVDRLVTKKLVCFAYLQIGVIQATAGFYSYMVVLQDYGYYSWTLPGLGADDNWGKQMLMCKTVGGVLRNEEGKYFHTLIDFADQAHGKEHFKLINQAFSEGYMFWDWNVAPGAPEGAVKGATERCVHVPRVLFNSASSGSAKWYDPSTFGSEATTFIGGSGRVNASLSDIKTTTDGRPLFTVNSIFALRRAGFIEYTPFAGRMSNYYVSAWNKFDTQADPASGKNGISLVTGFGSSYANSLHFLSQPVGYYVAPKQDVGEGTSIYSGIAAQFAESEAKDALFHLELKQELNKAFTKGVVDVPEYTTDTANLCTQWSMPDANTIESNHGVACNEAEWALADRMYSYKMGDKVYANIANRMMQKEALSYAQTSGFTTIIVVQWADLMICKTRWLSITHQGMKNGLMNFGLLFETILGTALCYVTFLNIALTTRPLRFTHWFPGMPFCILIFLYDEYRKYRMRTTTTESVDPVTQKITKKLGWVGRNTYY